MKWKGFILRGVWMFSVSFCLTFRLIRTKLLVKWKSNQIFTRDEYDQNHGIILWEPRISRAHYHGNLARLTEWQWQTDRVTAQKQCKRIILKLTGAHRRARNRSLNPLSSFTLILDPPLSSSLSHSKSPGGVCETETHQADQTGTLQYRDHKQTESGGCVCVEGDILGIWYSSREDNGKLCICTILYTIYIQNIQKVSAFYVCCVCASLCVHRTKVVWYRIWPECDEKERVGKPTWLKLLPALKEKRKYHSGRERSSASVLNIIAIVRVGRV